ncbi:hypothetical protein ANAPH2_01528 [Anaplasma phagocytophilum]|nr:hypothetical protein ANAPH2_01528 [Anaplasma phagocytophilum]
MHLKQRLALSINARNYYAVFSTLVIHISTLNMYICNKMSPLLLLQFIFAYNINTPQVAISVLLLAACFVFVNNDAKSLVTSQQPPCNRSH